MSDKLNIHNEMRQFDTKNRHFYDELTDEERKKFSNFLLLRWGSAVQTSNARGISADEMTSYYVQVMNQRVNKHFWSLNKHPKLQWLLLTTVSPNAGSHKHEWVAFKGKQAKNKRAQSLIKLMPHLKNDDAEVLSKLMSEDEFVEMLRDHGWADSDIKKEIKSK